MALEVQEGPAGEWAKLEHIVRAKTALVRLVARARIVLLSLDGLSAPTIAAQVGASEKTGRHWIKRCIVAGLAGWTTRPARDGR